MGPRRRLCPFSHHRIMNNAEAALHYALVRYCYCEVIQEWAAGSRLAAHLLEGDATVESIVDFDAARAARRGSAA